MSLLVDEKRDMVQCSESYGQIKSDQFRGLGRNFCSLRDSVSGGHSNARLVDIREVHSDLVENQIFGLLMLLSTSQKELINRVCHIYCICSLVGMCVC